MNQFILTNTPLINKNNSLIVKLGKKIEDRIFDYKLCKNTIDLFLKNCVKNSTTHTTHTRSTSWRTF